MNKQLSQSQVVHTVLETIVRSDISITANFDDIEFYNNYPVTLMEKELKRDEIHTRLREAIQKIITDNPLRESFLVTIYDAIEIKPGAIGIKIDIKKIVEHFVPNIREKLSGVKFKKGSLESLHFLITRSGSKVQVSLEECKEQLGDKLFDALKEAGMIREYIRDEFQWVELSHDMLIPSILHK